MLSPIKPWDRVYGESPQTPCAMRVCLGFSRMIDFVEVALLLALVDAVGLAGSFLCQPLIAGFIAADLLAGPSALNIVVATGYIELMSELGIAVLLFLGGIKLDVALIRSLGYVAVVTGLGHVTSLYVAVALT